MIVMEHETTRDRVRQSFWVIVIPWAAFMTVAILSGGLEWPIGALLIPIWIAGLIWVWRRRT